MVKNKLLIALLTTFSINVQAVQWLCTQNNKVKNTSTKELNIRMAAEVYSGAQILIGNAWLNACMLRPHDPLTRQAFSSLKPYGVASAETSEKFAKTPGVFDRTIKIVHSESEMIDCIQSNAPAIGYVAFYGGTSVVPCN
jgi:hypothetical protein